MQAIAMNFIKIQQNVCDYCQYAALMFVLQYNSLCYAYPNVCSLFYVLQYAIEMFLTANRMRTG